MIVNLLKRARWFATRKHDGQKYGHIPFIVHPAQVSKIAKDHGLPVEVQVAAWLHDILEDTDTHAIELMKYFGKDVTRLVSAVTDWPGRNRKERTALTWPRIRDAGSLAVALKLCDRIANVEACQAQNPKLLKMYQKEHDRFRKVMYRADEYEDLWTRLEAVTDTNQKG